MENAGMRNKYLQGGLGAFRKADCGEAFRSEKLMVIFPSNQNPLYLWRAG
jgi:hypothetical protein